MNLCDSEAVLVFMVSSRLAKIKHGILPTRLPLPPKKKRKRKKETCMDIREGRVLFISERDCNCHANQSCSLAEQGHIYSLSSQEAWSFDNPKNLAN